MIIPLIQWSDEGVPKALLNPKGRRAQEGMSQRELKMATYYQIIDLLDKGKVRQSKRIIDKSLKTTEMHSYLKKKNKLKTIEKNVEWRRLSLNKSSTGSVCFLNGAVL